MHFSLLDYKDSKKAARSYLLCLICLRVRWRVHFAVLDGNVKRIYLARGIAARREQ